MPFSEYTEREKKIAEDAAWHNVQSGNESAAESNIRSIVRVIGHENSHTIRHRREEDNPKLARLYKGIEGLEFLRQQAYRTLKDPDAKVFQGLQDNRHWKNDMPGKDKTNSVHTTCFYSEKTGCILIIDPSNSMDWGTVFPSDSKKFESLKDTIKKITRSQGCDFREGLNNRPDKGKNGALGMEKLKGIDHYLANRGISLDRLFKNPSKAGLFPWETLRLNFNIAGADKIAEEKADILPEQLTILQSAGLKDLKSEQGQKLNVPAILRDTRLREIFLGQLETARSKTGDPVEEARLKKMIDASHTFLGLEAQPTMSSTDKGDRKPLKPTSGHALQ